MKNTVITISRQFGSQGREIGRQLAKKLDIPCYDKEIIAEISQRSGLSEKFIHAQEKNIKKKSLLGAISGFDLYDYSNKIAIWNEQSRIIKEMAEKESCVIVGRCADFVLKNENVNLVKVFVYASDEVRLRKTMELFDLDETSAKRMIKQEDANRYTYYQMYTDQKFADMTQYDICLNTDTLTISDCANTIEGLIKGKVW